MKRLQQSCGAVPSGAVAPGDKAARPLREAASRRLRNPLLVSDGVQMDMQTEMQLPKLMPTSTRVDLNGPSVRIGRTSVWPGSMVPLSVSCPAALPWFPRPMEPGFPAAHWLRFACAVLATSQSPKLPESGRHSDAVAVPCKIADSGVPFATGPRPWHQRGTTSASLSCLIVDISPAQPRKAIAGQLVFGFEILACQVCKFCAETDAPKKQVGDGLGSLLEHFGRCSLGGRRRVPVATAFLDGGMGYELSA